METSFEKFVESITPPFTGNLTALEIAEIEQAEFEKRYERENKKREKHLQDVADETKCV